MTSSNGRQVHLYRLMVARTVGLCAVTSFSINTAHSHDLMRPELNAWFKSLKNKAGEPCCDGGDGQYAEAEWDTAKNGYRVLLKNPQRPSERGQWFDVPNSVVLNRQNLSGRAMVWWWPTYADGRMTPLWRCFIPGPEG
ncbi:hypothetical protein GGD66_001672 [Bradyrhizobium sp. CIR48]|uniref:hypothetical protein n=1 Tax=unclassified Bradyrhizobium TaxID=2631580 RepID=UPI0008E0E96D|nr:MULTISPECIES: hypothetical protein [unclassified Bradyrhizobium]MBB4376284.1 hypothetical protein [Bradyrhizobium sp. SBR1B]MBB4423132.1 hypothetical protein [Bradyrhizobium sp. CIR48]SFN42991.1 hypothetical protein SAMN05216573_1133 [Bradyrhizobium sp. Rc3b]